jgi:hypothetical protein
MKLKFIELNTFLKGRVADSSQYSRAVAIALGVALGRNAPMPSSMPVLARMFYAENLQAGVERACADFNENILVDLDLAANTARSIWLVRAGLCHPSPMIDVPEAGTPGDALVALSGAGFTLSRDVYDYIAANQEVIFVMANRITAALSPQEEERRAGRRSQAA